MTAGDIVNIEQSLRLILPEPYRRLMAEYPFAERSTPAQAYIPNTPTYACRLNHDLRHDATYWKSHFFAVGHTYGGDAFLVDTSALKSPVFKASQQSQSVSEIAPDFDTWISQLREWYLDFDTDVAQQIYADLRIAIEAAGFFTTPAEPMDGWHRISIASKRRQHGNSFWVAFFNGNWYAGTWSGFIYHVHGLISAFCIDWMIKVPHGTYADFENDIKHGHRLQSLTDKEFDMIIHTPLA